MHNQAVGDVKGPYSQPAMRYLNEQAYFEQSKQVMLAAIKIPK